MPAETHSHRGPLDRDEVERIVREQLARSSRSTPTRSRSTRASRDDLDADDFALIELVEALEDELGERTVGFTIDDDDLVELRTVRDAVDCVVGRLGVGAARDVSRVHGAASPRRRSTALEAHARRARSPTASLLAALARAPLVVRGARRVGVERAARVPRRLGARPRRHDYVFEHFPQPARRPALRSARRRRERATCSPRSRSELDLGAAPAARQGRRRGRRPREAVDPRRRVRSGDRRGVPRRRPRRPRATSCCAASSERIAEAAAGPGRPRLQDAAPGARGRSGAIGCPRYQSCATRAPTTPSTSSPPCYFGDERVRRRARAARRSRPSRPRRGSRGTRLQDEADGAGGRAMPELPEVEVLRRDLETEVVGKKIKAVEVDGHALGPPAPATASSSSTRSIGRKIIGGRAAGQVPVLQLDGDDVLVDPPRHVGPAAARRRRRARRRRSTRTS